MGLQDDRFLVFHRSAPTDELVHPLERDVDCIRKFLLRRAQRPKKFFREDFPWMGWFSICGYPHHSPSHQIDLRTEE